MKNLDQPQRKSSRLDMPDLTKQDTCRRYLDTRFEQLRVAADLGMWQEAFRSIEDIFNLIAISQKSGGRPPRPELMAVYYQRMTQIFRMSNSMLFLGFTWYKLFSLYNLHLKTLSLQDQSTMASAVVLSALSILPFDRQLETRSLDAQMDLDRLVRMANLLGVPHEKHDVAKALCRDALVREIKSKGMLDVVPPEVRDMFILVEETFDPLGKCRTLHTLLNRLDALDVPFTTLGAGAALEGAHLGSFKKGVMNAAILSTFRQLGSIYSSVRLSSFTEMVPFSSFRDLEHLVVDAQRCGYLECRVDHRRGVVVFGRACQRLEDVSGCLTHLGNELARSLATVGLDASVVETTTTTKSTATTTATTTATSKSSSSSAAGATGMTTTTAFIVDQASFQHLPYGYQPPMDVQQRARALQQEVLRAAAAAAEEARVLGPQLAARKRYLEERKAAQEEELARVAEEEARRREASRLEAAQAEEKRMNMERQKREHARFLEDQDALDQEEARRLAESRGRKIVAGEKLDKQELLREEAQERMEKHKKLLEKLRKLEKTMDYLERARREFEEPKGE